MSTSCNHQHLFCLVSSFVSISPASSRPVLFVKFPLAGRSPGPTFPDQIPFKSWQKRRTASCPTNHRECRSPTANEQVIRGGHEVFPRHRKSISRTRIGPCTDSPPRDLEFLGAAVPMHLRGAAIGQLSPVPMVNS